ncbi:MAG: GtrA family protein [Rothia sp. (in: high G+C Gram-positive bacteria)]|uniref:GtrA family protein n=1 Tax=Rothia sp. (in: high G+C Gram-positive bacteria) TaxID=1885016 RepID=UPI0026E09AA3|nr:GtrA family protein [Rothia sp. (in: high G+C Gram-positive bacteria)]MDO5750301.1 GtrA family protein [Rothia sp. (in: high G+C Gram-positive bacteria)]
MADNAPEQNTVQNSKLRQIWDKYAIELLKFGTVGGAAFVVNSVVVWTLMNTIMQDAHTKAKVIASIVATIFSWLANRLWTFREDRSENWKREAIEFGIVNILGILVEAGCVAFSTYVLNLRTPTASFISGTIIGTILGTILRYFLYRFWVYGAHRKQAEEEGETEEERIGRILEEATEIMTGSIPKVQAQNASQSARVHIETEDEPKTI